jgi:hypothetical protein
LRIAKGFILRKIVDTWVVIPTGSKLVEFNGILNLNESGALLWQKLESGAQKDELVSVLVDEYLISASDAQTDVEMFLAEMKTKGLIL